MEACTGNIYIFVQSIVVTRSFTERQKLMTWVIIDALLHALTHAYPWCEPTYLYVYTVIYLALAYELIRVTQGYFWYGNDS